jgi:hypothetical protein
MVSFSARAKSQLMNRPVAPLSRPLLQTIQEQIVSDVEAKTALTGMELEAEHWQQKEAAAAHRYT